MNTQEVNVELTSVIKGRHIDEKGQAKKDSYYWILPEDLSAEAGDMAFVETSQGSQIVHIISVQKWEKEKIDKLIRKVSEVRQREPEEMKKVIAIQPKPKG